MSDEVPASRVDLLIGRRMTGKTTKALHLALTERDGVFVYDPANRVDAGIIVYEEDWKEAVKYHIERYNALSPEDRKPFVLVMKLRVSIMDRRASGRESAAMEGFYSFLDPLQMVHNIAIFIDEASFLYVGGKAHPALNAIIRNGRGQGWYIVQTCHRFVDVELNVRNLINHLYWFRTKNRDDANDMRSWCGDDPADAALTLLPAREYVWVDFDSDQWEIVRADRAGEWYVETVKLSA